MSETETISWILLATAFASEQKPANFESISQIADGINHAVPTHRELQASLNWLSNTGLVEKRGKKYILTTSGAKTMDKAKARTNNIIMNIWGELTAEIENTKAEQKL